jgi:stage V sporulation protein D (sporulation-specific penicillin-binding protein)
LRLITWGLLAVALVLCGRLVQIQIPRRDFYTHKGEEISPRGEIPALRPGCIYDASGRVLADAAAVADLALDPVAARQGKERYELLQQCLVQTLRLAPERVSAILAADDRYVPLAKAVPLATVQQLRALRLPGLIIHNGYRRSYPYARVAANLVGAYSADARPLAGLEYQYRFLLAGDPGTPRRNVDAWGRTIVGMEGDVSLPSAAGKSVVTTLDLNVQRETEAALDRLWATNKPECATVVVMEPRTGAILAMASRPNFDPNDFSPVGGGPHNPVANSSMLNLPVNWEYEPGSTFKVVMAAAALQNNAVTMGQTFHCGGGMTVGGRPLHCWGKWAVQGHGNLNLGGILANSCNLGAAQVVQRVGASRYVEFLRACGFGRRTGIGLPGEGQGQVRDADRLGVRDLANMGFGQSVLVTPLQLTAALCGILNEGVYMQPQLLRRVVNADTARTVYRDVAPRAKATVCSPEVSRLVREMMVGVVERGTGRSARIPGAVLGAKTGTAQIFDPRTGTFPSDQKVVSFVLTGPAQRVPDFVILVVAKNPKVGQHGSDVAGPAAKDIALFMLRQRGFIPQGAASAGGPVDPGLVE